MACNGLGSCLPLGTARQSIAAAVSEEKKARGNRFSC